MVRFAKSNVNETPPDVHRLVVELSSDNGRLRRRAREQLAEIGQAAVPALIQALHSSNEQARWEAAKTLVEIGDLSIVPVLVKVLDDVNGDIRWLAAEGLIHIGHEALVPLLQALIEHSDSVWMREGAHHVLHTLARGDLADVLAPVLVAMEDIAPVLEVPVAAYVAEARLLEMRRE